MNCGNCKYNGERGCVIIGIVYCGEKHDWRLWKASGQWKPKVIKGGKHEG